jgi:tetratricopeptide (TPR) repeat protein
LVARAGEGFNPAGRDDANGSREGAAGDTLGAGRRAMYEKNRLLPVLIFLGAMVVALPAVADAITDCNQENDPDIGIRGCTATIKQNPRQASAAYNNRGLHYQNKRDYDQAIADFNRAIALDPKDANAYSNRGNIYDKKATTIAPSPTLPRPSRSIRSTSRPTSIAATPI